MKNVLLKSLLISIAIGVSATAIASVPRPVDKAFEGLFAEEVHPQLGQLIKSLSPEEMQELNNRVIALDVMSFSILRGAIGASKEMATGGGRSYTYTKTDETDFEIVVDEFDLTSLLQQQVK